MLRVSCDTDECHNLLTTRERDWGASVRLRVLVSHLCGFTMVDLKPHRIVSNLRSVPKPTWYGSNRRLCEASLGWPWSRLNVRPSGWPQAHSLVGTLGVWMIHSSPFRTMTFCNLHIAWSLLLSVSMPVPPLLISSLRAFPNALSSIFQNMEVPIDPSVVMTAAAKSHSLAVQASSW